jgi:glyoxylase-like metal-dependent hydrolase (beta-lactamase superfamily II)
MTLEDHLGDIVSKARDAAGVSAEAAARAARLAPAELERLEATGQSSTPADLRALAGLIGLDGAKLEGIAGGWRPAVQDLGPWRELRVITTTRGGNAVNCCLVWDEVSREGALFDTGWEAAPVLRLVDEERVQLKHVFLTHSHTDHVAALPDVQARFPKLLLHTSAKHAPPHHRNRSNDFIHLGSLRITNRDTPGHAEDGVTYIVGNWPEDAPAVAIIGDTLFAGSLARGFQSADLLKQKVREQIFTLPPATLLCPGHGPLTTVAEEKAHNPFF